MPYFPEIERVALPVTFQRYVPGRLHPDGRRYLPLLVFRLANDAQIGVVDRHHLVDPELAGRSGVARLVFLLSDVELQRPGVQRKGVQPEATPSGRVATSLEAYGEVVAVPTAEVRRGALSYAVLYTELLLDVGLGIVGVRTSVTAADLSAKLGKARFEAGDWIHIAHSRVDILGFEKDASGHPARG